MNLKRLLFVLSFTITALLAVVLALSPHAAQAGGIVHAPCNEARLRAALAGGGSVGFFCFGPTTISISSPLIITQSTDVEGGGEITLDGGSTTRLFYVTAGVTLTLRNLTLTNGYSGASDGGAISNDGTLYLENSRIEGSSTDINHSGGAIFSSGPLFITNSTFSANYGGSADSSQYSDLTEVNRSNVARLHVIWKYQTGDSGKYLFNPLITHGVMYVLARQNSIGAWG